LSDVTNLLLSEESLLEKAQKQQDLVVMSYDSEGTTKVLYEPKANYEIDRIEAMIDQNNRFRCLTMYLSTLANFLCSFSCLPVNDKAKLQTMAHECLTGQ
jgi:hypothetical protein